MEEILKKLDENVFTPEVVSSLKEAHETAIKSISEKLEKELLAKDMEIAELKVKAVEYIEALEESFAKEKQEMLEDVYKYVKDTEEELKEAHATEIEKLIEEADIYTANNVDTIIESVDRYIELSVKEYVEENKIAMLESVKQYKLDALLEGFDSILRTAGTSLSDISESKSESETTSIDNEESLNATINSLIKENRRLKEDMNNITKTGIYKTVSKGLSLVQEEKFVKLVEMVKFDSKDVESYEKKLSYIKSQLVEQADEPKVEDSLVESTKKVEGHYDYSRYV